MGTKFVSPGFPFLTCAEARRHQHTTHAVLLVTANVTISSIGNRKTRRITIEDVYPAVDYGRYSAKRIAGEPIDVWADIFRDGHAVLAAELLWRHEDTTRWVRTPMRAHQNDRWSATFTPPRAGRYFYAIEAWTNHYASWQRDFIAKRDAGLNVTLEAREGVALLQKLRSRCELANITDPSAIPETIAEAAAKVDQTDLWRGQALGTNWSRAARAKSPGGTGRSTIASPGFRRSPRSASM